MTGRDQTLYHKKKARRWEKESFVITGKFVSVELMQFFLLVNNGQSCVSIAAGRVVFALQVQSGGTT